MSDETVTQTTRISLNDAVAELIRLGRTKRLQAEIDKRGQSQPRNPYLSSIGECDREMVYQITNWKDRPPIEPDLKARFEAGDEQEQIITRELSKLGFPVKLAQERVEVFGMVKGKKVLLATGKIDGTISYGGVDIPIEIKSMDPNIFRRIRDGREGIADFKLPHLRRYLRQLQMYLHGHGKPEGLFFLTDALGHWKIIPVDWDAGECEQILQRLERIYPVWSAAVANPEVPVEMPARIEYADDTCGRCQFATICLPDIVRAEAEVVTDPELIEKINAHETLKPMVAKYEELHSEIKHRFEKVKKALAGDYVVFGRQQTKKECVVKESTFWVTSIKKASEVGVRPGQ